MRDSYLIQRLDEPHGPLLGGLVKDNPFNFGGGYKNGGLSDDAMDLLRPIFSFDYMGAAEFEFGAVPEALQGIAKHAEAGTLEAWEFSVLYSKVGKPWGEEPNPPAPRTRAPLYALAPTEWREEVEARVLALAGPAKNRPYTKEAVMLNSALRPGTYEPRCRGWLELNNGYFFFIDRDMWAATSALFGVEVVEEV